MVRSVVLVDGDLLAVSRVESAARAAGAVFGTCRSTEIRVKLAREPIDLVIVDLDRGGRPALEELAATDDMPAPHRVIGFFSHVDDELRDAAKRAGVEAWPRGRLWRSLEQLLSE